MMSNTMILRGLLIFIKNSMTIDKDNIIIFRHMIRKSDYQNSISIRIVKFSLLFWYPKDSEQISKLSWYICFKKCSKRCFWSDILKGKYITYTTSSIVRITTCPKFYHVTNFCYSDMITVDRRGHAQFWWDWDPVAIRYNGVRRCSVWIRS